MITNSTLLTPVMILLTIFWLTFFALPASLLRLGTGLVGQFRSYLLRRKMALLNGEVNSSVYRSILITGAASGIGHELARSYASLKTTVYLGLVDINGEALERTAQEICNYFPKVHVKFYVADVTKPEEMRQLVKDFDKHKIDLVIANAGVFMAPRDGTTQSTEYSEWSEDIRKTMEVNLMGVINTITPAISLFKTRKSGHIVVISSLSAFYSTPVLAGYGASKVAVFRLVRDLGAQLKKDNIYTTCVCPGFIDTAMTRSSEAFSRNGTKRKLPFLLPVTQAVKPIIDGIAYKDEIIAFPFTTHAICWLLNCTPPLIINQVQRYLSRK